MRFLISITVVVVVAAAAIIVVIVDLVCCCFSFGVMTRWFKQKKCVFIILKDNVENVSVHDRWVRRF